MHLGVQFGEPPSEAHAKAFDYVAIIVKLVFIAPTERERRRAT